MNKWKVLLVSYHGLTGKTSLFQKIPFDHLGGANGNYHSKFINSEENFEILDEVNHGFFNQACYSFPPCRTAIIMIVDLSERCEKWKAKLANSMFQHQCQHYCPIDTVFYWVGTKADVLQLSVEESLIVLRSIIPEDVPNNKYFVTSANNNIGIHEGVKQIHDDLILLNHQSETVAVSQGKAQPMANSPR